MNNRIHAYHPIPLPAQNNKSVKEKTNFSDILKEQQQIQVSKHASHRMQERSIHLSSTDWNKMNTKLEEAKNKGVKESLVIMEKAAFIINAENKKMITAMDRSEINSKIFTNINGTILID